MLTGVIGYVENQLELIHSIQSLCCMFQLKKFQLIPNRNTR